MATPSGGATIRADINAVVEEASAAEKFFIGTKVLPPFGVDAKSGTYPKFKKQAGELLKAGSTVRNPKSEYGKVARMWETDTYDTVDRGLEELIDDTERKDSARFFDMEAMTAKLVLRSIMLDHEIRTAAAVINATTFGAGTNSVVAYTYANIATIDAVTDILAAIERVNANGEDANTVIMSSTVWNLLQQSTRLQNFLRGSRPSDAQLNATPNDLAAALAPNGISQVLVGRARYDGAIKGQTYSATSVWGNTYVWVGNVQGGDFMNGGAGRTLVWNAEGGLWVSETYRDDARRSDVVRVRQHTAEKVINAAAGTLITTQYA